MALFRWFSFLLGLLHKPRVFFGARLACLRGDTFKVYTAHRHILIHHSQVHKEHFSEALDKKKNYILNMESLPSSLQALLLETGGFQDKTKIRLRSTLDALFGFSKQSHLTRSSGSGVEPHCFLCRRLPAQVSAGVPLSLSWRWWNSDREDPQPQPPHEAFHFPNVHAGPLRFIWG